MQKYNYQYSTPVNLHDIFTFANKVLDKLARLLAHTFAVILIMSNLQT